VVGGGGGIYTGVTTDYISWTWTPRTSAPTNASWQSVASSSDGTKLVAVGGGIYISTNYGETWTPKLDDISRLWKSVSVSKSGQYQTAVVNSSSISGYIYISSDFGNTWIVRLTDTCRKWHSVSISDSGQYQTAVVYCNAFDINLPDLENNFGLNLLEFIDNGYIYISGDFGNTWKVELNNLSRKWISVSISATGQYQTAVENNGFIYITNKNNYDIMHLYKIPNNRLHKNCRLI
jgi:photosystem II stability/assembly factor-like uncharacterized protein